MITSNSYHENKEFKGLSLSGQRFHDMEFESCRFVSCQLVEAELERCRFSDCQFVSCDLSLVKIPETKFKQTRFEDSKLVGVNWAVADWSLAGIGSPIQFSGCALNHSVLIGLELPGLRLIDCVCHEVDFRGAALAGAIFSGTDLAGTLFQDTDLSQADFSRARNYSIAASENTLSGAKFSMPEVMALLDGLDIELVNSGDE